MYRVVERVEAGEMGGDADGEDVQVEVRLLQEDMRAKAVTGAISGGR